MSSDPFDLGNIPGPDVESANEVAARAREVLRPRGALDRLDELAIWLAGWQRSARPEIASPAVVIFGGDHGATAERVSAYPAAVTGAMVEALREGTATAAVMARHLGATLEVVDVGVGKPTGNIRVEPAMSDEDLKRAIETGRETIANLESPDVIALGEIGIGNTTSAAAISMALFGGRAADWVGPGTGLSGSALAHKVQVVDEAVVRAAPSGPLDALRQLGGSELAAIAGALAEARHRSIPVLLDGFVVTSAAMVLLVAERTSLDHCWPGHVSGEPGHRRLVERIGKKPILDLELRLGEASGALAALPVLAMAARALIDVATFQEVGLE